MGTCVFPIRSQMRNSEIFTKLTHDSDADNVSLDFLGIDHDS